ncbi:response regulator transcription factor [Pseudoalteromonas sp. AS84]|jgi:two-component system response regulator RstA|uniref:response regulator transcription factor n=1 Tax=Pseudoalteromonas TaxID=53246 RepID=UPI00317A3FF0
MNFSSKILLIEDDEELSHLLTNYLSGYGFNVIALNSGENAVEVILTHDPDMVILDLMLPKVDGLTIGVQLRKQFKGIILMLTASADDMDQVAALEMGIDDFMQKPVLPRVLLAKIKNLLSRKASIQEKILIQPSNKERTYGALWLSNQLKRCKLDNQLIHLTPSEFSLLWHLVENSEQVISREELIKSLRNIDYDGLDRSIDNKVSQIRKKLKDNASRPQGIITVRGKGYMFVPDFW